MMWNFATIADCSSAAIKCAAIRLILVPPLSLPPSLSPTLSSSSSLKIHAEGTMTTIDYGAIFNCVCAASVEASSLPSFWHTFRVEARQLQGDAYNCVCECEYVVCVCGVCVKPTQIWQSNSKFLRSGPRNHHKQPRGKVTKVMNYPGKYTLREGERERRVCQCISCGGGYHTWHTHTHTLTLSCFFRCLTVGSVFHFSSLWPIDYALPLACHFPHTHTHIHAHTRTCWSEQWSCLDLIVILFSPCLVYGFSNKFFIRFLRCVTV